MLNDFLGYYIETVFIELCFLAFQYWEFNQTGRKQRTDTSERCEELTMTNVTTEPVHYLFISR